MVTVFTQKYGPFGYLDKTNYNDFCDADFQKMMSTIEAEVNRHVRSKEQFVTHYLNKYEEKNLPFWMVAELLTFGNILTIYRKMHRPIQQEIALEFGMPVVIMESWLLTLNHVRNICAHHARLWNRRLGIRPQIPTIKKYQEWAKISNEKPFVVLMILSQLLKKMCSKNRMENTCRNVDG